MKLLPAMAAALLFSGLCATLLAYQRRIFESGLHGIILRFASLVSQNPMLSLAALFRVSVVLGLASRYGDGSPWPYPRLFVRRLALAVASGQDFARQCHFYPKYGNSGMPHHLRCVDNSDRTDCHFGRISMAREVRKKPPTQSVFELACEAQDLENEELEGLDRLQILDQSVLSPRKVSDRLNRNRL